MRFLFCESSRNFGGQESQILLQMEALQAAGHCVSLACPENSRIAAEASARGQSWSAVSFRNSLHVPSIRKVRSLTLSHQADAVICHSGHDANVAGIAARLIFSNRPKVLRVRTYLAGRARPFSVNFLADRTVTPSRFLREKILETPGVSPARVGILRPIVPAERLREQSKTPLNQELAAWIAAHSPIVVHAAMLRSEKGHRLALAALGKLKEAFPKIGYVMAGFGTKESELRKLVAAKNLTDHAHFAGMVSPVAPLLSRADLVIMPSSSEPLGLSQLEALALGIPVAVSDAGGLPETITDHQTGRIFPVGDIDAWVCGLTEILNSPEVSHQMASHGKHFVEMNYSAAAHIDSLLEHLATIGKPG
jgi:glycosyltransferase involved in cell wall biosynthesis